MDVPIISPNQPEPKIKHGVILATLDMDCFICHRPIGSLVMPANGQIPQHALTPLKNVFIQKNIRAVCQQHREEYGTDPDMSDLK